MWNDLNSKDELIMNQGKFIRSSFYQTIKSKRNKTLEKYLLFILEEEGRLTDIKNGNIWLSEKKENTNQKQMFWDFPNY